MKFNPKDERKFPDFNKLQRQGLYHESQADGHFEEESPRKLSRFDNNPFKSTPCLAPPMKEVLELEEGCPNFGGGNRVTPLEERELSALVDPEPMPTINELPFQWPAAIDRIIQVAKERDEFGFKKYGTRLRPFNGRDPLKDAFQEGLDLLVYIEQELFERSYKQAVLDAALDIVNNGTLDKKFNERFEVMCKAVRKLKEIQKGNKVRL